MAKIDPNWPDVRSMCRMCDMPLRMNRYGEWVHTKDGSIHCFEKASVATPDLPERTEGTQRYIDSGEYEGEYND